MFLPHIDLLFQPGHYLGHLIGHEGKGSLLSELKSRGNFIVKTLDRSP